LHDQGHLTDQRTAMAGAIAARAILRAGRARWESLARAHRRTAGQVAPTPSRTGFGVWCGHAIASAASALASEVRGEAVSLEQMCARADVIVTTTPSTEPLLSVDMIRPGLGFVAVGADSPGKRELDPRILSRGRTVVDSIAQCVDHGEAGWAVRAGLIDPASLLELGSLLEAPIAFAPDEIVVADLTGVAIQDFEIAKKCLASPAIRSPWLVIQPKRAADRPLSPSLPGGGYRTSPPNSGDNCASELTSSFLNICLRWSLTVWRLMPRLSAICAESRPRNSSR